MHWRHFDHLKEANAQGCPALTHSRGIVLQQNNDEPHTSIVTHQKLWQLGWKVLMQPSYGTNRAPSANDFSGEELTSKVAWQNRLFQFLANSGKGLYERGMMTFVTAVAIFGF